MPPIQIHSNSPINTTAAKASGQPSTPRSPLEPYSPRKLSTALPTSPTTTSSFNWSATAARPGAVPFPGPTSPALPAPTQSVPTPTRTTQPPAYDGPPLPQPGASPSPYAPPNTLGYGLSAFNNTGGVTGTPSKQPLPPPPKAGERTTALQSGSTNENYTTSASETSTYGYPSATGYPPQASMNLTSLSTNYAPTRSTTTSTTSLTPTQYTFHPLGAPALGSLSQPPTPRTISNPFVTGGGATNSNMSSGAATPSWLPAPGSEVQAVFRRGSLEHPPGYMQDPTAGEMTAAQRAVHEQRVREGGDGVGVLGSLTGGAANDTFGGTGATVGDAVGRRASAIGAIFGAGNSGGGTGGGSGGGGAGAGALEAIGNVANGEVVGENVGKAWGAAKKWVGAAAEKVGEMEGEVWRRVGGA